MRLSRRQRDVLFWLEEQCREAGTTSVVVSLDTIADTISADRSVVAAALRGLRSKRLVVVVEKGVTSHPSRWGIPYLGAQPVTPGRTAIADVTGEDGSIIQRGSG